nr:unnamed protein product [Callosobruchus chinensis]
MTVVIKIPNIDLSMLFSTSLEYCSHIWGAAAPTTLSMLDAAQRRAIRLIGELALTCHLQPLSDQRGEFYISLIQMQVKENVQRRKIRLIGDPALTSHLQSLSYQRADSDHC